MPPNTSVWAVACLLSSILVLSCAIMPGTTRPRFSAAYSLKITVNSTDARRTANFAELAQILPNLGLASDFFDTPSASPLYPDYSLSTSGLIDVDTFNNIFRYNITSLTYKKGAKSVSNGKLRYTTLLMYDLVHGTGRTAPTYAYGTNFTWANSNCQCEPIRPEHGGGSPPILSMPEGATKIGQKSITVNGKAIRSDLYTYNATSYTFNQETNQTSPVDIQYEYYVSTSYEDLLDRVSYTFYLVSGVSSSVKYDFWGQHTVDNPYAILPDASCAKSCTGPKIGTVRVMPILDYQDTCVEVPDQACMCINATADSRLFCDVPWAVSSDLSLYDTDEYAYLLRNLTVNTQPNSIPADCAAELSRFMCAFYFPPCNSLGARFRPPINGFLKCFSQNPVFYNQNAPQVRDWTDRYAESEEEWIEHLFGSKTSYSNAIKDTNRYTRESTTSFGPIAEIPTTQQPIPSPENQNPPVSHPTPVETVPSVPPETISVPTEEPTNNEPSNTPLEQPSVGTPISPPVTPPVEPVAAPVPQDTPVPVAPVLMTNASIAYAVSFVTFTAFDVVAGKTTVYPDIYTLKNWQIALMLFGTIGLLLTIAISCVMVHRRVTSHYEKV